MKNSDYKVEIGRLITEATDEDADNGLRMDLLDRYNAEHYDDNSGLAPVKGRSQYLDTTASDAVDAIHADVMDIFTSAPRLLDWVPMGPDDEEAAEQEADIMHHLFFNMNNGYENLYTWTKEAMTQQNAYCWSGWVEREKITIEEYENFSELELTQILSQIDGDYEILEIEGIEAFEDEDTGEVTYSQSDEDTYIKFRCTKRSKEYEVETFPQEEFFGTPRWKKVSLEGIPCHGRRREMTKSQLMEMGFSEESIEKATQKEDDAEKAARHTGRHIHEGEEDQRDTVEVYEAHVYVDYMEDGRDRLVKAYMYGTGTECLEWKDGKEAIEEVSSTRISAITPNIVPHRHIGRSIVEQVEDIQKVNTVLMRQLLDNIYLNNHGRPHFDEYKAGKNTYSDLASPRAGAPVRTGGAEITYHLPPSIAPSVMPVMEKMDDLTEKRTGATRYNQGLDADSLNKTMGGMQMIMNASQKKTKLIARTIAETGLRDLFVRMHADLRQGPMKEITVKLRGKWVTVDPTSWRERTDMTPAVGIGKGDNDQVRAGLSLLGQVQRELMASGSVMVDEQKIFNTIESVADTFGIKNVEKYLNNPATTPPPPPAPPAPDPIMEGLAVEERKNQAAAQRDAAKLAADEREKERQFELKMREFELRELEINERSQTNEDRLDLDRKNAVMKDDLERDKMTAQNTPAVSYNSVTNGN